MSRITIVSTPLDDQARPRKFYSEVLDFQACGGNVTGPGSAGRFNRIMENLFGL
jgi:hypothetical protein